MNFSAVIFAGGKSSRMGRDKARLEIGGQTLLARQIQIARETGAWKIFISARAAENYPDFGCRVLEDKFQNAGPLAGIARALEEIATPLLLALAVDMPNVNANLIQKLFARCSENSGAIPRVNGDIEPLPAFYPKAAQSLAASLLKENSNGLKHFAEICVGADLATFVDLPPPDKIFFMNWNSPADLPPDLQADSIRAISPRRTVPPCSTEA